MAKPSFLGEIVHNFLSFFRKDEPEPVEEPVRYGFIQSPINLQRRKCNMAKYEPFEYENFSAPLRAVIVNKGGIITIEITDPVKPILKGGGLEGTYVLDNIHFHWAAEHTIDDVRSCMECHMEFYLNKYETVEEAYENNGVIVLAVLYKNSAKDNYLINTLLGHLPQISIRNYRPFKISKAIFMNQLMPSDDTKFFRYVGSSTFPPYPENVVWTVFLERKNITKKQLLAFTDIYDEEGRDVENNYRSIQQLSEHEVYATF